MFGGSKLFGGTTTTNPLQPSQPQQPQVTTQSVAQICNDTNLLMKSLCGPEIFNDDRDRVVARLNQVLVSLGVGSGFYASDKQPIQYNDKNMFFRNKGVVYNKVCTNADEDGICALILNVSTNQLSDKAQQDNLANKVDEILGQKQMVNTIVEAVKAVDANNTEVCIHVYEKGIGKVRATHLFKYLSQPDKLKMLETQLKCTKIVPVTKLTDEDKDKYLNTPPEGFDPNYWIQGVRNNPKPQVFLPAPVYGFEQLLQRQKMQKTSDAIQLTTAEQVDIRRDKLDQSLGYYLSKVKVLKNQQKELSHRLFRIAVSLAKETRQGYGLTTKEDELSAFGEQCNAMLFSPNALKDRVKDIFALLENDKEKISEYFASVNINLTDEEIEDLRFGVSNVQNKLEKNTKLLAKDRKDIEILQKS